MKTTRFLKEDIRSSQRAIANMLVICYHKINESLCANVDGSYTKFVKIKAFNSSMISLTDRFHHVSQMIDDYFEEGKLSDSGIFLYEEDIPGLIKGIQESLNDLIEETI